MWVALITSQHSRTAKLAIKYRNVSIMKRIQKLDDPNNESNTFIPAKAQMSNAKIIIKTAS